MRQIDGAGGRILKVRIHPSTALAAGLGDTIFGHQLEHDEHVRVGDVHFDGDKPAPETLQ